MVRADAVSRVGDDELHLSRVFSGYFDREGRSVATHDRALEFADAIQPDLKDDGTVVADFVIDADERLENVIAIIEGDADFGGGMHTKAAAIAIPIQL